MSSRRNHLLSRAAALACEALEPRRLLTFVVSGTAAPDIIQMYGGSVFPSCAPVRMPPPATRFA